MRVLTDRMNEETYLRERESLDFFIGADGSAPSAFTLNRPDFKVRPAGFGVADDAVHRPARRPRCARCVGCVPDHR